MSTNRVVIPLMLVISVFILSFILLSKVDGSMRSQQRPAEQDRQALVGLENEWLNNEHDPLKLETILASDFLHPVPTGDLLTKAQHIYYAEKFAPPGNLKRRFDELKVRLYGDVGIVNGIVITSDEKQRDIKRTVFTDVFVYRNGNWQAVNAQENQVEEKPPKLPGQHS